MMDESNPTNNDAAESNRDINIPYKITVHKFFDDQHAADPTVLVEDILLAAKVMFPQITRGEMVTLLIEYLKDAPRIDPSARKVKP